METVSNMANLAKSTVLGDNSNNKNNTSSKNSQEQDKVQTDQEPPSGGPPGAGTPQSPFDPGNRPEQEELTGTSTKTGMERTSPTGEEADSVQPITSTFQPAVKTKAGTAKEGSHSALFGLGEGRDEGRKSIHSPPTSDGDSSSTNPAAAAAMAAANQKDAGTDRRGAVGDQVDANGPRDVSSEQSQRNAQIEDDDACGYTGLKKAALEEQEEKKRMGGSDDSTKAQAGSLSSRQNRSVDAIAREEARDPSELTIVLTYTTPLLLTISSFLQHS